MLLQRRASGDRPAARCSMRKPAQSAATPLQSPTALSLHFPTLRITLNSWNDLAHGRAVAEGVRGGGEMSDVPRVQTCESTATRAPQATGTRRRGRRSPAGSGRKQKGHTARLRVVQDTACYCVSDRAGDGLQKAKCSPRPPCGEVLCVSQSEAPSSVGKQARSTQSPAGTGRALPTATGRPVCGEPCDRCPALINTALAAATHRAVGLTQ